MRIPEIGELNRRATFMLKQSVPNQQSGFDSKTTKTFQVWAKLEVIGGSQFWGSMQVNRTTTHRIWVRQMPGLTLPVDLTKLVHIEIDNLRYKCKRVTDVNSERRFTIIEAEELRGV